jgi:hypothetical protein
MFLGGGFLLAMGLFMISGQADRTVKAAKMVANVLPQGRVLNAVKAAS